MHQSEIPAACYAYLGTLVGASLFGLIQGGFFGMVFGAVFAAVFGILIVPTVYAVSWSFWLVRFRTVTSFLAGATTGVICTVRFFDDVLFALPYGLSIAAAVVFGGAAAAFAVSFYSKSTEKPNGRRIVFSLSDMFRHLTVLSVIIAAWTCIIAWVAESDAQLERQNQEIQRQLDAYGND